MTVDLMLICLLEESEFCPQQPQNCACAHVYNLDKRRQTYHVYFFVIKKRAFSCVEDFADYSKDIEEIRS